MQSNNHDEKKLYFIKINGMSYPYMIIAYKMSEALEWFEKEMHVEPDCIEFTRNIHFYKDLTIQEEQ